MLVWQPRVQETRGPAMSSISNLITSSESITAAYRITGSQHIAPTATISTILHMVSHRTRFRATTGRHTTVSHQPAFAVSIMEHHT